MEGTQVNEGLDLHLKYLPFSEEKQIVEIPINLITGDKNIPSTFKG